MRMRGFDWQARFTAIIKDKSCNLIHLGFQCQKLVSSFHPWKTRLLHPFNLHLSLYKTTRYGILFYSKLVHDEKECYDWSLERSEFCRLDFRLNKFHRFTFVKQCSKEKLTFSLTTKGRLSKAIFVDQQRTKLQL